MYFAIVPRTKEVISTYLHKVPHIVFKRDEYRCVVGLSNETMLEYACNTMRFDLDTLHTFPAFSFISLTDDMGINLYKAKKVACELGLEFHNISAIPTVFGDTESLVEYAKKVSDVELTQYHLFLNIQCFKI